MAENGRVAGDPLAGGTYSQLLFSDHDDNVVGLDHTDHGCSFNYSSTHFAEKPPKMLCFGDYNKNIGNEPTRISGQKFVVTCSDSSSASSTNNTNSLPKSSINRKRNGYENSNLAQDLSTGAASPARSQRNCKKMKPENSTVTGHAKVKKEKLGERVSALQQLVSPFGKTDTASVLHEAMGYIKFLQEQVQFLCSPYLQRLPSDYYLHHHEGKEKREGELRKDLRSRGLCLVPVECTVHVAETNGADFWSPAMVNNGSSQR